jgi:hypothetical protein
MTSTDTSHEVLERALGVLIALTGSRAGAIFKCSDSGDPLLCASHRVDQRVLDQVKAAWTYGRDALALGQLSECPGGGVVDPVLAARKLAALVYLDQLGKAQPQEISLIKTLIASRAGETGVVDEQPVALDERQQLLLLLERSEWNIARVARILGVSRLTTYRRLGRLGITRPA